MEPNKNSSFNTTIVPSYDPSSKVPSHLLCKLCNELMNDVHQASCGCRYCSICLDKIILNGKCHDCGEVITDEKTKDRAAQKEINNLTLKCKRCSWEGPLIQLIEHCKTHSFIDCEFCAKKFEFDKDYQNHLDIANGDCQLQPISCPYSEIGCAKTDLLRSNIESHFISDLKTHFNLFYHNVLPRIKFIESKSTKSYDSNIDMDQTIISPTPLSTIPSDSGIASSFTSSTQSKSKIKSIDSSSLTKKTKLESDLNSKYSMIEFNVTSLSNDLNKHIHMYEKLVKDFEESKSNEKKLKEQLENLQKTLTLTQANIISLDERLLTVEKVSYNGNLIWKIPNVNEKIVEARSGRQTSIYSPPFYTNQTGFKMCARLYLNGDGMGRGTHISMFFVVLRGEYDALLKWPFRQKVTFILIDQIQSDSKENVIDAFRPDPNSNSFKRPTSDMNIASGIPLFCPLSKFNSSDHEYVKDNTMFVKIVVDARDLIDI